MNLTESIQGIIDESISKVDAIIKVEYPQDLSLLAKEIFDSAGKTHGRNWLDNTESTTKKKGKNHRNVESGDLQLYLETPGVLEQEDYMTSLPTPKRSKDPNGYIYANNLAKFDDIGRTPDDEQWLEQKLTEAIINGYR